jgi:hypothetical protein
MAFREKILWSSLAITLGIWGWYFAGFVGALKAGRFDQGAATGAFIQAVVLLVAIQVVAAIVIAIATGRDAGAPADAREKAFALEAYRPAYIVLSACVVTLMGAGSVLLRIANEWHPAPPPGMAPVLLANALLASLVLAQLVHSGWQIARFRMGG